MSYKYLGRFYQNYMTSLKITKEQRQKCGAELFYWISKCNIEDNIQLTDMFAHVLYIYDTYPIASESVTEHINDTMLSDDYKIIQLMKKAYLRDKQKIDP